jgi:6-pyruvoyltetrahydropterin/6-carboxytetrahydropterin synthase
MFELRKSFHFEASHVLTHHEGKCSRMHGHSYVLTLVLRGRALQPSGPQRNMLTDFCDVSAAAKGMIAAYLDHHHLNTTLKEDSPTAEFIARWVYRHLAPTLPQLAEVELRETATASVVYRPSRGTRRDMRSRASCQAANALPLHGGGNGATRGNGWTAHQASGGNGAACGGNAAELVRDKGVASDSGSDDESSSGGSGSASDVADHRSSTWARENQAAHTAGDELSACTGMDRLEISQNGHFQSVRKQ